MRRKRDIYIDVDGFATLTRYCTVCRIYLKPGAEAEHARRHPENHLKPPVSRIRRKEITDHA